jgi:hypothetical protein
LSELAPPSHLQLAAAVLAMEGPVWDSVFPVLPLLPVSGRPGLSPGWARDQQQLIVPLEVLVGCLCVPSGGILHITGGTQHTQ